MNNSFFQKTDTKLDLVFAKDAGELLVNVRSHLEKQDLSPVSLNIIREHNNFCAVVTGKKREGFIG